MTRLIQFRNGPRHAVARIDKDQAIEIPGVSTTLELAAAAWNAGRSLEDEIAARGAGRSSDYAALLAKGAVLSPADHPDPAHCLVTGTGLTHLGSASARDAMHKKSEAETGEETDSLKMFNMGLRGGRPEGAGPGVQPEWFYKGDGAMLVPPGGNLPSPSFALDGGEEPEVVGVYWIAPDGTPLRLGFALGNEFSDHLMERQNYLYLAHSKLRACSIGPELRLGDLPPHLEGESRIRRGGAIVWRKPFLTGEANMSHALANLEYHHFKYAAFRRPGDLHIHFLGTATLSIADGFRTEPGDIFEIEQSDFGAPLRNALVAAPEDFAYSNVKML